MLQFRKEHFTRTHEAIQREGAVAESELVVGDLGEKSKTCGFGLDGVLSES